MVKVSHAFSAIGEIEIEGEIEIGIYMRYFVCIILSSLYIHPSIIMSFRQSFFSAARSPSNPFPSLFLPIYLSVCVCEWLCVCPCPVKSWTFFIAFCLLLCATSCLHHPTMIGLSGIFIWISQSFQITCSTYRHYLLSLEKPIASDPRKESEYRWARYMSAVVFPGCFYHFVHLWVKYAVTFSLPAANIILLPNWIHQPEWLQFYTRIHTSTLSVLDSSTAF